MRNRRFLYILRPGREHGEFQKIARWTRVFPSLWKILLAHAEPVMAVHERQDVDDHAVYNTMADAGGALDRFRHCVQFLRRHPQVDQVAGLQRYLEGAYEHLSDLVAAWSIAGQPAPVLCAYLDEQPGGMSSEEVPTDLAGVTHGQPTQPAQLWEAFQQAMLRNDFDAIESLLEFRAVDSSVADWKAWSGVFGLALFEHGYFCHAFREPLAVDYADYEYDELGSEDFLGGDLYRYKSNGLWGVRRWMGDQEVIVLPAEWDRVLRSGDPESETSDRCYGDTLVWVKRNRRFGLAAIAGEPAGRLLIEPCLDEVGEFVNGVALARCGSGMGLLATTGCWHVKPVWDEMCAYANGYAVARRDGKFGFIDVSGEIAIAAYLDEADDFTAAGTARVRKGQLCGLLRGDGSVALPFEYERLDWSGEFSGWIGRSGDSLVLLHADGSPWVAAGWDAIEVCVPRHSIRVARGGYAGLLRWSGAALVACEYDELRPRDRRWIEVPGAGPHDARLHASAADRPAEFVARRSGRMGLLSEAGEPLVPFEFDAIESLEPHFHAGQSLIAPDLVRVVSMPGAAKPLRGIWDIHRQRYIVPCKYDFIWITLLGQGEDYGFIVANRNAKRGDSAKGRYRVGMLRADGATLIDQSYAWIGESTELNRPDARDEIRNTIHFEWSRGEPVPASARKNGPVVWLPLANSSGNTLKYQEIGFNK